MLVLDGGQGAVYCLCPTTTSYKLIQTTDTEFKNATGIEHWKSEFFVRKNNTLVGRWKLNAQTGKLDRVTSPTVVLSNIVLFSGGEEGRAFALTSNNELLKFSSNLASAVAIPLNVEISNPMTLQTFNNDLFIIDQDGSRLIQVDATTGAVIGTKSGYTFGSGESLQAVQLSGIVPTIDGYWATVKAYDRIAHLTPALTMDGVLPVSAVHIRPYIIMAGIKGIQADSAGRVAVYSSSSIDIYTETEHSPVQYLSIVPDKLKELNAILEQIPMDELFNNPNQSVLSRPEVKAFLQEQINGGQP